MDWKNGKAQLEEREYQTYIIRIYVVMFIIACILAICSYAKAETHEHGITVPDWYDLDCCSKNDCHPVEDKEVDFFTDKFAKPVAIYTNGDVIRVFDKSRWRKSKDEHYHACFRGEVVYCIYIPIGV